MTDPAGETRLFAAAEYLSAKRIKPNALLPGRRGRVARDYCRDMSDRPARLRAAYQGLGRGDLDPWMTLLDPRVVWRAVDQPDVPETPT